MARKAIPSEILAKVRRKLRTTERQAKTLIYATMDGFKIDTEQAGQLLLALAALRKALR